jgi:predicted Zn-dependent protease
MKELEDGDPWMRSIEGKVRFHEGNLPEAERIFLELIDEKEAESDLFFLEGVILMQKGEPGEAAGYFRRAADMEPDFPLYRFRLAESLHLAGYPAEGELQRALELNPEDGWLHNLAGVIEMERGAYGRAREYLEKAYALLPEEREVQINYSGALLHTEGMAGAQEVLTLDGDPYVLNHRGNLYADSGDVERAVEWYRQALEHIPEEPVFLENIASALLQLEHYAEAEEYLVRMLDTGDRVPVRAYEMIAEIAQQKGEFERAAATLEEALKIEPDNSRVLLNLARLLTRRGHWERAKQHLERLREEESGESGEEVRALLQQVREATEERYECSSCGREWWVPKDAELPERVRLYGEPPGESPAGMCPSCGRVFCIECAMNHMDGQRFVCPHCGDRLKLSDGGLKYLALLYAHRRHEHP